MIKVFKSAIGEFILAYWPVTVSFDSYMATCEAVYFYKESCVVGAFHREELKTGKEHPEWSYVIETLEKLGVPKQ